MEALATEQRLVAERPRDSQTFVFGGPGTGKTHTLGERVKTLLDGEDGEAADGLLVLSFTRAAVAELRQRLGGHRVARLVDPTTIDAHARRVLIRQGLKLSPGDFDRTIAAAARCVAESEEVDERYWHIIIDEAQDLAEPRLTFVREMLKRADGFTVFGDPAQSIYGFRSREYADPITALRDGFPAAESLTLTIDHRAQRPRASPAVNVRDELLRGDAARARGRLLRILREMPRVSGEQLAIVLKHADARSAVACRNGGEVLQISLGLHQQGVMHRIQPGSDAVIPPTWIAATLAGAESEVLTRDAFDDTATFAEADVRDAMWASLERVAGRADGGVRLELIRTRISAVASGDVTGGADRLPVISTVHRIKGREFDRVFVLDPAEPRDQEDDAEEARILYVAMTRARADTLMLSRPKPEFAVRRRGDRWVASPWRSERVLRVEVRVGDIDRGWPLTEEGSAAFIQRHLRTKVAPGDPVVLERTSRYGSTTYEVLHKGLAVAKVKEGVVAALDRLGATPGTITDIYIAAVSSAAGDPATTRGAEIGSGGFWLVPEITGFGRLS
jgi:hypothetical protein